MFDKELVLIDSSGSLNMKWKSPADIVEEFQLNPEDGSIESVIRSIRIELGASHPDKSDGTFQNPDAEVRWQKLAAAKEYLESGMTENALIAVNTLPAIIEAVVQAASQPISTRRAEFLAESHRAIRGDTLLPKISSGALGCVFFFLFTTSGLKEHPLIGHVVSTPLAQLVLLLGMLFAGGWFLFLWIKERRLEERLDWLLTPSGVRVMLKRAVSRSGEQSADGASMLRFSRVVEYVASTLKRARSHGGNVGAIEQNAAKLLMDTWLAEGLVKAPTKGALDPIFVVEDHVLRELEDARFYS